MVVIFLHPVICVYVAPVLSQMFGGVFTFGGLSLNKVWDCLWVGGFASYRSAFCSIAKEARNSQIDPVGLEPKSLIVASFGAWVP